MPFTSSWARSNTGSISGGGNDPALALPPVAGGEGLSIEARLFRGATVKQIAQPTASFAASMWARADCSACLVEIAALQTFVSNGGSDQWAAG
ncbi:hypothetical protein IMF27_24975 [Pseudomonas sp. PCH199]|uniref:hypothetical protein n=1 Tax=unclassified Pseudomonas TaxID=196821 RepID=UPI000BD6A4D1|nr:MULTISPECIES: hypothetical protein [unclassified Pseudomonas]MCW8278410.1 hypothetical protein [Pseudomonas sp. PCH199]PAM81340.1 hypothetical protein CES87_25490 [Pseudomonas sp. ERMR1:02]